MVLAKLILSKCLCVLSEMMLNQTLIFYESKRTNHNPAFLTLFGKDMWSCNSYCTSIIKCNFFVVVIGPLVSGQWGSNMLVVLIWDSVKIPQLEETLALVSNFPE